MSSDLDPPRIFTTITSAKVEYNMDTVEYLIGQEDQRRAQNKKSALTPHERAEFRRNLIATLIIRGDAAKAVEMRPMTQTKQLNG